MSSNGAQTLGYACIGPHTGHLNESCPPRLMTLEVRFYLAHAHTMKPPNQPTNNDYNANNRFQDLSTSNRLGLPGELSRIALSLRRTDNKSPNLPKHGSFYSPEPHPAHWCYRQPQTVSSHGPLHVTNDCLGSSPATVSDCH